MPAHKGRLESQGFIERAGKRQLLRVLTEGDVVVLVKGTAPADLAALRITAPLLLLLQGAHGATRHVVIDPWATGKTIRPVGGANVLDPDVVVF